MRVLVLTVAVLIVAPRADVSADGGPRAAVDVAALAATSPDDTTPTAVTINEFFPEDRSLGDCISSLPRPDCGSDARGGWRQTLVFVAILAGLAFIAWRIVAQSRKAGP